MGQHLPTVTLTHVPDREKESKGKTEEKEIRLQTPVFSLVSFSYSAAATLSPGAKSPKPPVHSRQVTGNRDLTTAGGTQTISKGKGGQRDSERKEKRGRGKTLRGSTGWRYGRFSKQSLCALSRGKHL